MMKKNLFLSVLMACCVCLVLVSCEKAVFDEEQPKGEETCQLRVSVKAFDVIPFDITRAGAALTSYCTRLNFVVYQNGKKVKGVSQEIGDEDYGSVSMTLEPGAYQLLVLAHSAKENPTLTSPEKIQFTNKSGFTDTFYYYSDIEVETSGANSYELELERVTAMFRLITTDAVPANVSRMRFYYTGGSGALDATKGVGCINSIQTVFFDMTDDMHGKPLRLEAFTIPKDQTGKLKMTITAYDANDEVVCEREDEFADIPIERNKITEYTGAFFTKNDHQQGNQDVDNGNSFEVRGNTEWAGTLNRSF